MKNVILIIGMMTSVNIHAQENILLGSNDIAAIKSLNIEHPSVLTHLLNPSFLSQNHEYVVGIYAEQKYMIPQWRLCQFSCLFPVKKEMSGIDIKLVDFTSIKEIQCNFSFAKSISKNTNIGIGVGCLFNKIIGYQRDMAFSNQIGCTMLLSPKVSGGISFDNILNRFIASSAMAQLPYRYSFQFSYVPSANFIIGLQMQKTENEPMFISPQIQYEVNNKCYFNFSCNDETNSIKAGVGFKLKQLDLYISNSYHNLLGLTSGVMISIEL